MVFLALLPLIVVIAALVVGVDIIISALLGLATALVVAFAAFPAFDLAAMGQAGQNALLLAATVALVLIPGQAFNLVLERSGILERFKAFVEAIAIDDATKALIITLGLMPAVESLTGFGVSLFVMVPIFLHLFATDKALRLLLLGMNIMPWGTLALATIVGAQLAGQSPHQLGWHTACFSVAVFPLLGVISAELLSPSSTTLRLKGLGLGLMTGGLLVALHLVLPVDVVGITAGLITTIAGYLLFRQPATRLGELSSLVPYGLLLAFLIATKLIVAALGELPASLALHSGNLTFAWYNSPGLPLIATAICCYFAYRRPAISSAAVLAKVAKPLLGIAIFILLSQVLVTSGAIASISAAFSGLDEGYLIGLAPVLGTLSGYITGSNLGGNVLMMPIQLGIAEHTDLGPWIAAVQNATAGHTLLASLPMIMLVLAIADASSFEQQLVRFSFKVLVAITALCAAVFALLH